MMNDIRFAINSRIYDALMGISALFADGYSSEDISKRPVAKKLHTLLNLWSHLFIVDVLDSIVVTDMHYSVSYNIYFCDYPDTREPAKGLTPSEAFEFITSMQNDAQYMAIAPVYQFKFQHCSKNCSKDHCVGCLWKDSEQSNF